MIDAPVQWKQSVLVANDLAFSGEPAARGLCRCSKAWQRARPLKRLC